MKRKLVIATMALILCGTPALTSVILPVRAEAVETAADSEETDTSAVSEEATPDFSKKTCYFSASFFLLIVFFC